MILKINDLTKNLGGKNVLDKLNLELDKGIILGILGPNGCGKTTLMKILSNLTLKDSGDIKINDEELSYITNKYISFLPDTGFMNKNITILQAIDNFSYFYEDFNKEKALKLLKELNLETNSKIKDLSKGMSEKLHLILILSRETKLYILDEPIAGVDIVTRKQILKLIIENTGSDSSIILTTHLINDIEHIFDEVCFLKDGSIDKVYNVEDLRINDNKSVEDLYLDYFGGYNE